MPTTQPREPEKPRRGKDDPTEDLDGKPTVTVTVHGNIGQRESPDEVKDDLREE